MKNNNKKLFTISDFNKKFPTEEAVFQFIAKERFGGEFAICPNCKYAASLKRYLQTKTFRCSHCHIKVSPLTGTIFENSKTPLSKWFYAILKFSNARNGVSATEMQREIGVTYKCAWRICKQIRSLLQENSYSENYIENIYVGTSRLSNSKKLTKVTHQDISIRSNKKGRTLPNNFYGQVKRSIDGTYHNVSTKYLPFYIGEFNFRFNHRTGPEDMFTTVITKALLQK